MHLSRALKQSAVAVLAAALLASGSGAFAGSGESGWRPGDDDVLLLQIRVGKFKPLNDVRGYQTPGGACVDLADVIQSLDLPIRLDRKSRRATGWFFAEDQTFTLDRDSNTVQNVNKTAQLAPGDLYDTDEGWCVDLAALSKWTGATFRLDMYDSAIVLESEKPLPFIEAIQRKSRAARLRPETDRFDFAGFPQAEMPYRAWRTPAVDASIRFGFQDRARGSGQSTFKYEFYSTGEIASASVNARLASDNMGKPESLRVRAFRFDPEAELLGPLKATQVVLGDVEAFSSQLSGGGGVGRGVSISNRPLNRPDRFASTTLRGAMPIGWEAEVYRNGQLLAFQDERADGRYEFDINLLYGANDLEVVLYGPQGQIRRDAMSMPVGANSLKPGQTEYWVAALEQNHDLISFFNNPTLTESGWRYGVGVERGLDRRTSAGASLHSLIFEGRRETYAELSLRRALGPMLFDLSAAQQFGQGRAYRLETLGRVGKINFQAETVWIDGGYSSSLVDNDLRREHRLRFDSSLKLGKMAVPFQAAFHQMARRDGRKVNEMSTRASLVMRGLSLTGELSYRQTTGGPPNARPDDKDGARASLLANTRIAGMPVRGEARFRLSGAKRGFEYARLSIEKNLSTNADAKFEMEHDEEEHRTRFALGVTRQFSKFALEGQGNYSSDGSFGLGLNLTFSFGPNPNGGGVRFSNQKLARTGQAGVSVFLDNDGDGRFSAGDKALPDIGITAGYDSARAPTDESGRTIVEGLRPYQPVLVAIDETSLPDPFLRASGKGVVITPRPGVATKVQLAVTPTGEVEGVLYGLSLTPRDGVVLELLDQAGKPVATTMTEYDGFFLFQQVPYGTYSLRVTRESAEVLGVRRELASGLQLKSGADLVRMGKVQLDARPGSIANADAARTGAPDG